MAPRRNCFLDMAILDSYHEKDEGERSKCQEQATRADQGRRGWRNRDHLPPWRACRGYCPNEKAQPQKAKARNPPRQDSSPRTGMVEAHVRRRSRFLRRRTRLGAVAPGHGCSDLRCGVTGTTHEAREHSFAKYGKHLRAERNFSFRNRYQGCPWQAE